MPLLSYHQHKHSDINLSSAIIVPPKPSTPSRQGTELSGSTESRGSERDLKDNVESQSKAMLRDEFLVNMQKFSSSITRTIQQIEGEVRLEVPELLLSDNVDENLRNEALMSQVEETCKNWNSQITNAIEVQQQKTPHGNGPLAEIDYWRERNAAFSALYEQLKAPRVRQLLDIYGHVDNTFEFLKQDLNKHYTEAKDNVRFLSTLERHFKNITYGASFQVCIFVFF